jgi:ABC-type oligopeptide transport system substrate-binding subunit
MKVTVWAFTQATGFNTTAMKLLESLGYQVSTKVVGKDYFGKVNDSRTKAQTGFYGWAPDYPTASAFFRYLFTCASFRPGDQTSANVTEYCDPSLDLQIRRALSLQSTSPTAARAAWQHIDKVVTDQALWCRSSTRRGSTSTRSASATTSTARTATGY